MDLYTTSFTLPHPSGTAHLTSSPHSSVLPLPASPDAAAGSTSHSAKRLSSSSAHALSQAAQAEREWAAVQKLCEEITTREGCLVTVSREQTGQELASQAKGPGGDTDSIGTAHPAWNFHLSGSYQNVMVARGAILRHAPRDSRAVIKVPRSEMLESPLAAVSVVKADVRRRLDDIARDSRTAIIVRNLALSNGGGGQVLYATEPPSPRHDPPSTRRMGSTDRLRGSKPNSAAPSESKGPSLPNSAKGSIDGLGALDADGKARPELNGSSVAYGLETERMCEVVVQGAMEGVEVAKLRALVMLDELTGLHSEICDIDYKLHAIIAGRRRAVIQSIQEETATNIYFPTPLVGVRDPPRPGTQQGVGYRNAGANGPSPGPGSGSGPGPMSMQSTGISMMTQATGHSFPPQPPSQMTGTGGGWGPPHANGFSHGPAYGHGNGHGHGHGRQNGPRPSGPVYNPHQHVQYPYQPQPMDFSHGPGRAPYNGPGAHPPHGFGMNGMASPMLGMNHTGHSSHSVMSPFQPNRGMMSPMPSHLAPHQNQHQQNPPHFAPPSPMHEHPPSHYGPSGSGHGYHPAHPQIYGQGHVHEHGPGHGPGPNPHQNHPHTNGGVHNGGAPGPHNVGLGVHVPGHFGAGPGPHPGLSVHGGEQGSLGKANQIWITGEFFGVQRARDMLLGIAMQKSRLVISRDTAILPRKLDWLLSDKLDEMRAILADNGTYMQVPSVGSQASLITVFGDHRVNIERTIRSIMALACQIYVASFWLLPIAFDVLMPQTALNPAQMQPVLKRISHATGAEVVFKSNCFEMHGLELEVRAAIVAVLELDLIKNFHHEIRCQIELANEHREFIAGKKNGKINKIMKVAGVKIKFETYNDYNFSLDISGTGPDALHGLSLLQEELPAEISFHVPESYHKRIIGVGGRNIQRIMKLYGVYVKFSNAEEHAMMGGYNDNEDNVVARTPAKNAVNLECLRQSVMELVNAKDKDYAVEQVSIPRRYHRTLLGEKSIFIHDIETKTNTRVRFPYKETGTDVVLLFGPESQVPIAGAMLLDLVPFEADLHVPPNAELARVVASAEFVLFAERIKREHQIAISPSVVSGHQAHGHQGPGEETAFKFRCQRSNIDFLGTARDALEEWLNGHGIHIFPANVSKRVDIISDAFSHFNSKILATRASAASAQHIDGEVSTSSSAPSLVTPPRPRQSTTDVKALFDGPPGTAPPGNFIVDDAAKGFAGPLVFNPGRTSEIWPAPVHSQPDQPAPPSKRGSDPGVTEKLRQATMHGLHVATPPSVLAAAHAHAHAAKTARGNGGMGERGSPGHVRGALSTAGNAMLLSSASAANGSGGAQAMMGGHTPGGTLSHAHSHSHRGAGGARTQSLDITSLSFARALAPAHSAGQAQGGQNAQNGSGDGATGAKYAGVDAIAQALRDVQVSQ